MVVTRKQQRLITGGLIGGAALALLFGAAYQGERLPEEPRVVGAETSDNGGGAAVTTPTAISPIEGFLPRSGEASACREPVGVDLISGYAATLTINGIAIAPELMNVVIGPDGEITNEITASRSLSQYTFGPEPDCPNGSVLRATDNVMRACVYRLEEGPASCAITEFTFDVL